MIPAYPGLKLGSCLAESLPVALECSVDHASGLVFHRPQAASHRRSVVYFYSAVLMLVSFSGKHEHQEPLERPRSRSCERRWASW